MNHLVIALIIFVCIFGSSLLGLYVRAMLPANHLSDDSINVVKMATGLIATMAALVLGLLVSSAKGSFDTMDHELVQSAASVVRLDRTLARYGTETHELRASLKHIYEGSIEMINSDDPAQLARLGGPEAVSRTEEFQRQVEALAPRNDEQRQLKARALAIVDDLFAGRWLALLQIKGSIPVSLLIVLVLWLCIIFGSFGLFAPGNATVIAALFMCALSTSGAIFLIQEMSTPLGGMVRVSVAPMRVALARLGE
ncbi:hypothetical protein B0G84_4142 [Paraburkholderia sp. BL8N3]|jgi:hypothetical protein|nr:hypothetical protein [Paraburkholderia sp. BL8N3]TCK38820.1 hypothetical protein B0G84_4142 [Paraburkholderia sp. BL8N3]